MFNTLKKVINIDSKGSDKKVTPSNDTNHANRTVPKGNGRGLFAGMNVKEMKTTDGSLVTAKVSEDAQRALDNAKVKDSKVSATTYSNTSVEETIATLFSEGDVEDALNRLRAYINENKGNVDKRYWFMLMDIYQILNDEKNFEKVALLFANSFGTSPPSWISNENNDKKSNISGKNIIILDSKLNDEQGLKFKDFLKASKEEKFCRINASQCKFEQSDFSGILLFYKLLVDLRKNRVFSVLMGDNILMSFCKSIVEQNHRGLKDEFLSHEQDFWLFYLELLQWKGKKEEFEELSFEYAMKFELSPPDWDKDGVMSTEKSQDEDLSNENQEFKLDKVLTYSNIDLMFDFIKEKFNSQNIVEIDMSHVERIDFASAGSITHFVQEILSEDSKKELIFKNSNEMIIILFEMLGINEFVTIQKKFR